MTQWIKPLILKFEDPSSDPQHPHKTWDEVAFVSNQLLWQDGRWRLQNSQRLSGQLAWNKQQL